MSLLDKASLIVTPNAYKESKLYSVVPSSGAGDMDVVRATTATRVNSAGLIEVVPRNLITYSNDLTQTSWTKSNTTITLNSIANPLNGLVNAQTFTPNTNNAAHFAFASGTTVAGQPYVMSFFVKANGYTNCRVENAATSQGIWFNLSSGTIISGTGGAITALSNGWYLVSYSLLSVGTSTQPLVSFAPSTSITFAGNGTSGGYVFGGQLTNGSTATEYFPTTTRLNIPRIDYTNGSCPSLLVEPQRTNVLTYSEQFDNAAWVKSSVGSGLNPVVTSNISTSPSGNNDADRIVFNTTLSTDISQIVQTIPLTVSSTGSVYLKAFASGDVGKIIAIRFNSAGYTLVTLTNSWQRFSVTATALGSFDIVLRPVIGTSTGSVSVLAWGAQLEAGSYATSYIPTLGASSVTRNADVISKTGISSLIDSQQGVLFADLQFLTGLGNIRSINISNGNNNNRIGFYGHPSVADRITFAISSGGVTTDINYNGVTLTNRNKVLIRYSGTTFTAFVNGVKSANQTFTPFAANFLNRIGLDYGEDILRYEGRINSIQLYKTALTDAECIALTTL